MCPILESGEIDLLVDSEPRVQGDFDSFPLYVDYFSFYTHKNLMGTYESTALIYVPRVFDENNNTLETIAYRTALRNNEKIELDSFTAVRSFCESGLGVAILPSRLAKSSKTQRLVNIRLPEVKQKYFGRHTIYATIHSSRREDTRIKLLVRELRGWFKN